MLILCVATGRDEVCARLRVLHQGLWLFRLAQDVIAGGNPLLTKMVAVTLLLLLLLLQVCWGHG